MTEQDRLKLPNCIAALDDLSCGCGQPELFYQAVIELLEYYGQSERIPGWVYEEKHRYFVANVLDHLELTEHGSSIGGAWLTDAGREALAFLREWGADWEERAGWICSEGVWRGRVPW